MAKREHLEATLSRIDGRSYRGYRDLARKYDLGHCDLVFDRIQADPFAAPSRVSLRVPLSRLDYEAEDLGSPVRRLALADYLSRCVRAACAKISQPRGSGVSGQINCPGGGQEILDRAAVVIGERTLKLRLRVGLPAQGRRVLGRQARAMLCEDLPELVKRKLPMSRLDEVELKAHLDAAEDSQALRRDMAKKGLVAFVPNGSILPRLSGVDGSPLPDAIPFQSPPSLELGLECPHAGSVKGMGIPEGITVIVGGGYHGKSTLLQALAHGIYDHIPGDGRCGVVSLRETMKIRAEEGRSLVGVDISNFIKDLPQGRSTQCFSTLDASGSTSQAGNIQEALEVGARVLLLDEDSSASNFMVRDQRMQVLISEEKDPIIPFVDRVQELYDVHGISTILVMGGSGDYLDLAHTVIGMEAYQPWDATTKAREVATKLPTLRPAVAADPLTLPRSRHLDVASLDPRRGRREVSIRNDRLQAVLYGESRVDITALEQLVDTGQSLALGYGIERLRRQHLKQQPDLAAAIVALQKELEEKGVDLLSTSPPRAELVSVRAMDVAAALNRLRGLALRN